MNFTNFKTIVRRLLKNRTIGLINIVGLGIGMACTILLVSWILHETSYDRYVPEGDKIYRVTLEGVLNGEFVNSSQCLAGAGPEAVKLFPDVENQARLVSGFDNCVIKMEDKDGFRESGYAADSTFFDIFPYKAIYGDLTKALTKKDLVVVDQYLAKKCFGDGDPIGEVISIDGHKYTVSGVMENIPANSHLKFHFLIPFINVDWIQNNLWGGDNSIIFLKLKNNNGIKSLEGRISELIYERKPFWKDLNIKFRLQNIHDIYFSNYKFDYSEKGNIKHIYIFGITAFLVLLIACINFTNLFIASALKRKRSIGIKLTNGAGRILILREFLLEVTLFLAISFLLAIVLIKIVQPYFILLSGKDIIIRIFAVKFLTISIPIILMALVLASVFPWLYLKGLDAATILKDSGSGNRKKFNVQKSLVTVQFVIAIVLIFNVFIMGKQMSFMKNKNLGFNKDNIVYVNADGKLQERKEQKRMKEDLLQNPNIIVCAYSGSIPTIWNNGNPLSEEPEYKKMIATEEVYIDEDYFDLMQIDFIEGENIYAKAPKANNVCIVNQQVIKRLGLEAPYMDKVIYKGENEPITIKGVVEDVNTKALTQTVDPCIYTLPNWENGLNGIIMFKISNNYEEAINAIKKYCMDVNPDVPFEYHFLDETYDKLYKSENNARTIVLWLTILAITITVMGLLAMVLFITESRVKEIGIRRANGAKVSEVMLMLNRDFVKWIVIAFVIASPVARYAVYKWLDNFAYKTEVSWWIFALSGLLALGIALLTVSWQSWRAARRNPVEALRYE